MPETQIVLRIRRTARPGREQAGFDDVAVTVDRERDTVLDAVERAWAKVDSTIVFRHACHHASCGTCAIRVNGRERLPCITPLSAVWDGRSKLTIEPLRNVPPIADLAVDPREQLERLAELRFPYVRTVESDVRCYARPTVDADIGTAERFEDCLECLACVSACPVAAGDPEYLGPAVLAAAQRIAEEPRHEDAQRVLDLVDTEHGVWQCRSVWACSAVCPSNVDPAARIMDLRRRLLRGDRGRPTAEASLAR
jgi:succinate dehydrogenase / fumarate reductase iron-sulfur subunit